MLTPTYLNIPSWLLAHLAELDKTDVGLLREVISAPGDRLACIAAALAIASDCSHQDRSKVFVMHLRESSCRSLLTYCAQGDLPPSFLPLLRKSSTSIQSPNFYLSLLNWLRGNPSPAKLKALHYAKSFTLKTLAVLDALDPIAIHVNTLAFVPNVYNARILNAQIRFVRACCPSVSEKEIGWHVRRLGKAYNAAWNEFHSGGEYFDKPNQFITGFINRLRFPDAPMNPCDEVDLLDTPKKMIDASLRFRNCLRDKIIDVARGERYYFIWRSSVGDAIVELRIEPPTGVRLNDIRAARNSEVPPLVRDEVVRFLEGQGIPDLPSWEDFLLEDIDSYHGEDFLKSWKQLSEDEEPSLQAA